MTDLGDVARGPPQVSAEAERFLSALERSGPLHFRAIPETLDAKARNVGDIRLINGPFAEQKQRLRVLNDQGYGIFVQPNISNDEGYKSANIVGCPAVFADFDGLDLDVVKRLNLTPHIAVETSPGKAHFYWRIADIPPEIFRNLQQRLINLFGSDNQVKDLARMMRLPGFLHLKDPERPHLVRIIQLAHAAPYKLCDLLDGLSAAEKSYPSTAPSSRSASRTVGGNEGRAGNSRLNDIKRAEDALRHLINHNVLNPGAYDDWWQMTCALKHSFGEDAFALFHSLSAEAAGYESEAACRAKWNSVDERPAGEALTIATFFKRAADAGWTTNNDVAKSGDGGLPTGAALAIIQAQLDGDDFFLDTDGTPHVRFKRVISGVERWLVCRITDDLYCQHVATRFLREAGKALAPDQRASATGLFAIQAVERGDIRPVFLRTAHLGDKIYIDVGNDTGAAIEVDGQGWRMVGAAPVLFRKGSRGALPTPEHGGAFTDFAAEFSNFSHDDICRVLGFIIGTFQVRGTCPLLMLSGGQGTGKSVAADKILALTDPPRRRGDGRTSFSRTEQELVIHALNAAVILFDNVSSFSATQADMLCRLASGTALSTRRLYTSDQEQVIALRRPVIVNAIGVPTTRGDLLDRSISVTAVTMPVRRMEEVIWQSFDGASGKLLGYVLDCVSAAIANASDVSRRVDAGSLKLPRLADFAAFVEGAARHMTLAPGDFSRLISDDQSAQQAEAAAGDPVGDALIDYLASAGGQFIGSAGELRSVLCGRVESRGDRVPHANKLRNHLERILPGLRDLGVIVAFEKAQGHRNVQTLKITTDERFAKLKVDDPF